MIGRVAPALLLLAAVTAAAAEPPRLGTDAQRDAGKKLYLANCAQCHGDLGDGKGVAASRLRPAPRDFTSGKFKIRTTPNGALPTDDDIRRIIRNGMPYTAMPAWPGFSADDVDDLVFYLKTFAPDFAQPARNVPPVELPKPPSSSDESIKAGRAVYEATGCVGCHGRLGRGDGESARTLKDDWGNPIRAADLTQRWTFRGGPTREDIFRTLSTGLNGSPMPSFADALKPEDRWHLTDFIYSLSPSDEPRYANLVMARHLDEPIDLAKGEALFSGAEPALFPVIGQIMEPGRAFHPSVTSVRVRAVYDDRSIAFLVQWDDMSAETSGSNSPALAVPPAEDEAPEPGAAPASQPSGGEGGFWGDTSGQPAATAQAPSSEFSDAVALQLPSQMPTGNRRPYFIFGDPQDPVDLWFVDLARHEARKLVGKGSASVTPADDEEIAAGARYEDGQWSVILERSLRSSTGISFAEGAFVPIAFSVWDGFDRERGSKRGLTAWYHVYVEPREVRSAAVPVAKSAAAAVGIEFLLVLLIRRSRSRKPRATAT